LINKQSLWFITLFSLVLILGIYYVSIPEVSIPTFSDDYTDSSSSIEVTESDVIIALKVEEEEKILSQMQEAQQTLLDTNASSDEKNEAYEALQLLNEKKGQVLEIEKMIKETFNTNACVKINGNQIDIILPSSDQGKTYANDVITAVQKLYDTQMYITVKFQK